MKSKNLLRSSVIGASGILVLFLAAACASRSQPATFYSLSESVTETGTPSSAASANIVIGLGPIKFPEYLNRPQIVTRTTPNELDISEFRRWAEPLPENFAHTLSEDLGLLLSTDRVFVYPWPPQIEAAYQILVEVQRFDGDIGGEVHLVSRWIVLDVKAGKVLMIRKSRITEPVGKNPDDPFKALVAAKSQAVAALAREIAGKIGKLMVS